MAKIDKILETLESRIARGDYAMTLLPTENGLAEEMGVGRMTARRALLRLVEQGLLHRDASGRLVVTIERSQNRPLQIGFVTAVLTSTAVRWQRAVEEMVRSRGGHVRVVPYQHWDDPTLLEATESFDGVFLIPPAETLPAPLRDRLQKSRARIAILGADLSSQSMHSVDVVSSGSVEVLLNHLHSLGHREIALLNTQPVVPAVEERMGEWERWTKKHKVRGELINEPEPSYGEPMQRAYREAKARIESRNGLGGTAVLCTTLPAAMGLMRATNEAGLRIGLDLSICTVNDEGLAPFLIPTLTSTRMIDPRPLLSECTDWMAGGIWSGPLLKCSGTIDLFVGQSTGKPGRHSKPSQETRWNERGYAQASLQDVA